MGWLIFMWFVILIVMLILYFIMIAFKVSKLYHDIEKRQKDDEIMLGTLYVVISSSKEEDYQKVKEELLEIYPDFSVSPYKESQMEKDAVEFFATCQITKEQAQEVLGQLNNDWDGEVDDCIAYGFNTKMFDSLVYHLNFQLYD